MTAERILALIPSYSGQLLELRELTEALLLSGADPFVVPTSAGLASRLTGSGIPHLRIEGNPGFGASITRAAALAGEWDWLMPVNDDITIEPEIMRTELERAVSGRRVLRLVYLDPGRPKPIPSVVGTLAQVSLLEPAFRRLQPYRPSQPPHDPRRVFRPFSIALISAALWDSIDGFDTRMVYTFEDADFGNRAAQCSAEVIFASALGVHHETSSTSRRHMDAVLPVAVWSAWAYLRVLGVRKNAARALLLAALGVRLFLVPLTRLPVPQHIRGLLRAMAALITNRQPHLPPYDGA